MAVNKKTVKVLQWYSAFMFEKVRQSRAGEEGVLVLSPMHEKLARRVGSNTSSHRTLVRWYLGLDHRRRGKAKRRMRQEMGLQRQQKETENG